MYFSKYKPFFSNKLLSYSFSLVTSRASVSLIFPYIADVNFVLFSTGKIPTLYKKRESSFASYGGRYLCNLQKKKKEIFYKAIYVTGLRKDIYKKKWCLRTLIALIFVNFFSFSSAPRNFICFTWTSLINLQAN